MKKRFKEYGIDERVAIVKQFSLDFMLWDYQTQNLLTVLNPLIKIHSSGFISFHSMDEQNQFYFTAQSFTNETPLP